MAIHQLTTSPIALEVAVLDLFYVAVAAAGFAVLWGITKACDRA